MDCSADDSRACLPRSRWVALLPKLQTREDELRISNEVCSILHFVVRCNIKSFTPNTVFQGGIYH